jgi:histidinol-phosphatase (PHP family)
MIDFHVHCDYSVDAQGTIEEYVQAGLKRGLSHICFTTHCDLEPDRRHHDGRVRLKGNIVDVTSDWAESYIGEVRQASQRYSAGGCDILCGLEVGYVPGIEGMIEKVITSHDFDFLLGGVHTLSGIDIVSAGESEDYFQTRSPRQLCEEYFHYLMGAVRSGLFDSIAHIDIYKRCGLEFYGDRLNDAHDGLAEPVLDEIAKQGMCLELNSGGLRKGLPSPYPSLDILEQAKRAGVADLTFGSDCHCPEDIGYGLASCLELAVEANFDRVALYKGRLRRTVPITEIRGA